SRTCSTASSPRGRSPTRRRIGFSPPPRTPSNAQFRRGCGPGPHPFVFLPSRRAGGASSLTVRSLRGPVDRRALSPRRRLSRREPEARLRLRPLPATPPGRTADVADAEAAAIHLCARPRRRTGPARRRQARLSAPAGVRRVDDVSLLRLLFPDELHDWPRLLRRRDLGG